MHEVQKHTCKCCNGNREEKNNYKYNYLFLSSGRYLSVASSLGIGRGARSLWPGAG